MAGLGRIRGILAAIVAAAPLSLFSVGVQAQSISGASGFEGSVADDMPDFPIPSEVRQGYSPIGEGFESPITPRADLKAAKPPPTEREPPPRAVPGETRPFFRDTDLALHSRTYWLNLHGFDGREYEALTSGGWVSYQSGYAADVLQLRAVLYTTQPLYAPPGAGRTLNLTPDGEQITALGQANARLKLAGHEITAGRQLLRTAFINPKDNRMIPLTFEGVVLLPERDKSLELDYIASYLWRFKPHVTDEFIPFSTPFGVAQDEGVLIAGIRHRAGSFNYGAINYWIKDTINTAYGEVDYVLPFGGGEDGPSYRISVNDLDQRSTGEGLIPGPSFATYQASVRLLTSYRGFVLTAAASTVGKEANIRDPYGNIPVFTSLHQSAFERAGEEAYLLTLSYDFTRLGIEGLKFLVGFGRGNDAINPRTRAPEPDREVLNLRLEYEPLTGRLEGLQMQLYYADQTLEDARLPSDSQKQFRAVVNYRVPLL